MGWGAFNPHITPTPPKTSKPSSTHPIPPQQLLQVQVEEKGKAVADLQQDKLELEAKARVYSF